MIRQLSLFDLPGMRREPDVGEYVKECGAVICHIMRRGYIGRKVLIDVSTQSVALFQCGIMDDYIPYEGRYRSIVNTGKRQRALITHYPGVEIWECLPWEHYEARQRTIGERSKL